MGLFVNNKFITTPRIEGSKQTVSSSFFIGNVPQANSSEEKRGTEYGTGGPSRKKKGGSGEGRSGDDSFSKVEWLRKKKSSYETPGTRV